jgi:hypothetical protein
VLKRDWREQIKTFHRESSQRGQFLPSLWWRRGWERQQRTQTRGDSAVQWRNRCEKQPVRPVGELTPQASAMRRLVSFQWWLVTSEQVQGCHSIVLGPPLFPGKQSPAKGGRSGSEGDPAWWSRIRMHSHSREAGLTRLWWIQGAISATLTMVGVDNITTKGPSNGVLMVGYFILFFYPMSFFFLTE